MPRFRGKPKRLSKPDHLELVRKEIKYSQDFRLQQGIDRRWTDLIDAYHGRYLDQDQQEFEDEIVINYAFSIMNVIWPSVSIKEPTISVLPRTAENEDKAILTQELLNYEWERLNIQKPMRRAVWDFLALGIGWVKVGWELREAERPMTEDEETAEIASRLQAEDARAIQDPYATDLKSDEDIALSVFGAKISEPIVDDPYAEYVSPYDMFVNAEATSMEDARWVAHRQIRTLEEAKADKTYNARVRSMLMPEAVLTQGLGDMQVDQERYADQIDRVVIWEFWDLDRNKMMVFSEQSEEFLAPPRDFPYHIGHPFIPIFNYQSTNHFYPQGDIEQIIPLVHELNVTRSQMLNHKRKYNRKWIAREDAFTEDARKHLTSSEDNVVAFVAKSYQGQLDQIIAPLPQIPIMADMYAVDERLSSDINRISGVSEYQQGGTPDTRATATEAAIVQDATNSRQAEKLSKVETFISEIAARLLGVMQQFMQEHRDVRVVGRLGGDPLWFAAEPDDIKGEFLFKVQAGSTQPTNETTRRTNAITAMQLLAPYAEIGIVDPVQLLKHVMQEGLDIKQPEKLMTQPAVQQLAAATQQARALSPVDGQQQGGAVGSDPNLQGANGVQAPQLDPREVLSLQQASQTVNGVPDQLTDQLAGQVGLTL